MSEASQTGGGLRRVVVTGMGAVTPLGHSVEALWKGCLAGCSGAAPITLFDSSAYITRFAAEVKNWDPSPYMDKKEVRRMDRFAQFAVAASRMALADAGITVNDDNRDRMGVYIGSGIGGLGTLEEQHKILLERGPGRVSPITIPGIICDMGAGMVSILLGIRGPNSCITTACATGANNIGDAYHVIRRGDADFMLAGGAEACITPLSMAGFCSARTLSTRNDAPELASRPFDANRDGFVMGEGAGTLLLESLDSALERGARIYAEVAGYGLSGDAHHITAPTPGGEGCARAMRMALKNAGLNPEDVDYYNAHGTSTGLNDKNETAALKLAFGDYAYKLQISSTKSMTGHMIGAAGAIELMICALAIKEGIIPPTINYETPDPECDLDYVPNKARKTEVKVAMSNSSGFGGHNAVAIFKRYEPAA
jgi:beta-ketoacyl-acyl-carrier-protein synthase II